MDNCEGHCEISGTFKPKILFPEVHHGCNVVEQLNKMFIPMPEVHSNLRAKISVE